MMMTGTPRIPTGDGPGDSQILQNNQDTKNLEKNTIPTILGDPCTNSDTKNIEKIRHTKTKKYNTLFFQIAMFLHEKV